jgi:transcription initiation factor TFIIB
MKNKQNFSQRFCLECKSTHLANYPDEECIVCLDCGFVISADTVERRTEAKRQKHLELSECKTQSKAPAKENQHKHPSFCCILKQWNKVKISDAMEKNIVLSLQYITEISIDLSVPKIALKKAIFIYKRIIENNLVKGRSIRALAATAIYIGCKQCGLAINGKRVAQVAKISPRKIASFYKVIVKQLDLKRQPARAGRYATDLYVKLKVSEQTICAAEKIHENLWHSKSLMGKDPTGIACAAIYISSVLNGEKRTQREIAEVARITEQTIRVRCREIKKALIFNTRL